MATNRSLIAPFAAIACALAPAIANSATVEHAVNPQTGIESWQLLDDGIDIMLMQISPDQARGFFLGRGFKREDADYYAASCVMAAIVKNHTKSIVTYNLADWRYVALGDEVRRKIKLRGDWLSEWRQRGLPQSSLIAFEWSQHPDKQVLEPDDWNQGMTTYRVRHGGQFNLTVKWKKGEAIRVETIPEIRCAN